MKINKFFLGLASLSFMGLVSCVDTDMDFSDSKTTPVDASCPGLEFSNSNITTIELDPSAPDFNIVVNRHATDAASYSIVVGNNQDNSFIVPEQVTFASGETSAELPIKISDSAAKGTPLTLTLAVNEKDMNPYTMGRKDITVKATLIKWDSIGKGYWTGNLINTFFGVDGGLPLIVNIEKATTSTAVKFRFVSPYASVATMQDELGGFDGYPYSEEGDLDGNVEKFVITVTKDGASIDPVNLGIDYGYGSFSIGQVYGNLSQNITSYPLGIYKETKTGGTITFPANSLYISMADYNDGGAYPCNAGSSVLYLSADDFKAAMEEEEEE